MTTVRLGLAAAFCLAAAGPAAAQFGAPAPAARPAVSPYINLFRRGSPALNYYGIVRPQVQAQQALGGLQQQVSTLDSELQTSAFGPAAGQGGEVQTGNGFGFQTQGSYFMTTGGAASGRGVTGGVGAGAGMGLGRGAGAGQGRGAGVRR